MGRSKKINYLVTLCLAVVFILTGTTYASAVTYEGDPTEVSQPTIVNGVLLVNKKVPLPASYVPSLVTKGEFKATEATFGAFERMKKDAKNGSKLDFRMVSSYRSYDHQKDLYNRYVTENGKDKADTFSARAGYSEHQTGLTLDVLGGSHQGLTEDFGNTVEGKWLAENAYKYGFIVRYPKGKDSITGYQYEPWHIRYIGVDEAKKMKDSGKSTLEEYLGVEGKTSSQIEKGESGGDGNDEEGDGEEGGTSGGSDYIESGEKEKFEPFRTHKITPTVVGIDNSQKTVPSELSYGSNELAKKIYKLCQYVMVLMSIGLIVFVSLQIASLAFAAHNGGTYTKKGQAIDSLLFGKEYSGDKRIKNVIKNFLIMMGILTITLGSYYVHVQAKIYELIASILSFIF